MASRFDNTRRDILKLLPGAAALGALPRAVFAQQQLPERAIPATGEALPVIGLGSSKVVQEIATEGVEPLRDVLATLVDHGGRVVDTWPRNADNDAAFGRVINEPDLAEELFVTAKIDQEGREVGIAQFEQTRSLYGRETLDLIQIFSLTDLDVHWPSLRGWKDEGLARYIGVTVAEYGLYEPLERFLANETPDFVQINYSLSERRAEDRLLPMLEDRGIAVLINRPFMNGVYFDRLEGTPLPAWTEEFGCESWAQFSLKYILANSSLTCVLTETTNPAHMAENARAAFGPMPDERARERMREFIDAL